MACRFSVLSQNTGGSLPRRNLDWRRSGTGRRVRSLYWALSSTAIAWCLSGCAQLDGSSAVAIGQRIAARSNEPERSEPARKPDVRSAATKDFGLPEPSGPIVASVLARVNGQPILAEEVLNAASARLWEAQSQTPAARWNEVRARILREELEEIINRELILQDAEARIPPKNMEKVRQIAHKEFESMLRKRKSQLKLHSDDELRAYIESQGLSLDEMRRQYERTFIAGEYARARIRPRLEAIARQDLYDYYLKNPKEFEQPEQIRWQHIFIDVDRFADREQARAHAQQVLQEASGVTRDEEFALLAQKYSHGPSQYRQGQGEGTQRGEIRPPEVEPILETLQPGQVGPLVETPRGFHIVRLVAYQPAGKVPFELASPQIRRKLQADLWQKEYKEFVKELRARAYIEMTQLR